MPGMWHAVWNEAFRAPAGILEGDVGTQDLLLP